MKELSRKGNIMVTTVAGDGTPGLKTDIDKQGNVYVADFLNNRIRKITFH